jgi:ankyrin repeat protein
MKSDPEYAQTKQEMVHKITRYTLELLSLRRTALLPVVEEIPTADHWLARRLTQNSDGLTRLHFAARFGLIEEVKALLDSPEGLTAIGGNDFTPLHAAAMEGHVEIAMLLISRHADPLSQDSLGRTPLHYAT